MKKLFYLLFGALVFTSCVKDVNPSNNVEFVQAQYANAFTNTFGEVASDQTWGFSTSTVRGVNAGDGDLNNNTWVNYGAENLTNITDEERQAVLDAIKKKVTGNRISEDVVFPWTAYFLQDVISGQNGNWTGAGSNGTSSSSYSFEAYSKGNQCNSPYWSHCSADEAANYLEVTNSAHLNNYYLLRDGKQTRINETTLMTDMEYGTYEEMKGKQFRWYINCHENKHWYEYIIVTVNGNYYICFDFGCGLPENDHDGHAGKGAEHNDWDYNDWILKITPAGNQPDIWTGWTFKCRVFAEDLSATTGTDFDFNDVVFDVYTDGTDAKVQLLAAGGTLELTVAGHEVHAAFGVSTNVMVNTGEKATVNSLEAEPFIVKGVSTLEQIRDNIHIVVTKLGTLCELHANQGEPAAKFAVPAQVDWADERQDIRDKYPDFGNWINDPSVIWWE